MEKETRKIAKILDALFYETYNIGYKALYHILTCSEKEFENIYGKEKENEETNNIDRTL